MSTRILATLKADSDNSNPGDVELFARRDAITVTLVNPKRSVTIPFDAIRLAVKQSEELQYES